MSNWQISGKIKFGFASLWFVFWLGIINRYQGFGDAFEVITGGWFISKGLLPYKDFFFHKPPLIYYLASFPQLLGFKEIYIFRFFLTAFYLVGWSFLLKFSKKSFKKATFLTMFLLPFFGTIFHYQMWLADNFVALGLLFIYVIFFQSAFRRKHKLNNKKIIFLSILVFVVLNSSLTSIFSLLPLLVYYLLKNFSSFKKFILAVLPINLIIPFYFWIENILKDFFWACFVFSQHYFIHRIGEPDEVQWGKFGFFYRVIKQFWLYISYQFLEFFQTLFNFVQASRFFNPLFFYRVQNISGLKVFLARYIDYIVIICEELIKNLLNFEMAIFLIYLSFTLFLIFKRKIAWLLFTFLFMIGLRARTNEAFHLAPYYLTALWLLSYLLVYFFTTKERKGFLFLGKILSFTLLLSIFYFSIKKYYSIAQKKEPIIDDPTEQLAEEIGNLSKDNDKIWVLGGNPILYFLTKRLPSNKYYFYFPVLHKASKIKKEVVSNIVYDGPKLVVFNDYKLWKENPNQYYALDLLGKIKKSFVLKNRLFLRR